MATTVAVDRRGRSRGTTSISWLPIEGAARATSLKEGTDMLKQYDDGAEGRWKAYAPNTGGATARNYQCNNHVDCGRLMRVAGDGAGGFQLYQAGSHASEKKECRRKNSSCTFAQEELVKQAIGLGSRPGIMVTNMTETKVDELVKEGCNTVDIHDTKRVEGGLDGTEYMLLLCIPLYSCIASLYS